MLATWISIEVEAEFLEAVSNGDFGLVDLVAEDFERMAEIVRQYVDLPLGTTDASVIALTERFGVTEAATRGRRRFTVVRPRHTDALAHLPDQLVH